VGWLLRRVLAESIEHIQPRGYLGVMPAIVIDGLSGLPDVAQGTVAPPRCGGSIRRTRPPYSGMASISGCRSNDACVV